MEKVIMCFAIGFFAQMIDGMLGMAYGVCCNTFLRIVLGAPIATSSVLVHFSEIFSSGASALSHYKFGNIDKSLFFRLLIPGVIGGSIGAYLVTEIGEWLEIPISIYLIVMGIVLIAKACMNSKPVRKSGAFLSSVALLGGFADATGGGGWGPIVTSSVINTDENAAKIIGSINASEFFITVVESLVFIISFDLSRLYWSELISLMLISAHKSP